MPLKTNSFEELFAEFDADDRRRVLADYFFMVGTHFSKKERHIDIAARREQPEHYDFRTSQA